MKLKRPLRGGEAGLDVRMVQRALNRWTAGVPIPVTGTYDQMTEVRVVAFQRDQKVSPASGKMGQATLDKLCPYFDAYGRWRYRIFRAPVPKPAVPDLGPVVSGGKSVLDQDLTHTTGGIDGYPAFDDGFRAGAVVIAPEPLTVTRLSSARRRDGNPNGKAFYATGASGIRYWFGHVEQIPAVGEKLAKGARLGLVSANHEAPHLHVGIDASALVGRQLQHHTDYTHGGATVGKQLAQ